MALVEILVAQGVNPVVPVGGQTPLHLAVTAGSPAICRVLLDRGALATTLNEDGKSALSLALSSGQKEIIELLLPPARLQAHGTGELFAAIRQGDAAVVEGFALSPPIPFF